MPVATRLTPAEREEKLATHADMMWLIANRLHSRNRSLSLEDIHAHVRLGFVLAASKFDPSRGLKFSTYAYRTGWGEAMNFCRAERARGFHVPMHHEPWNCPVMPEVCAKLDARRPRVMADPEPEPEFPKDFWKRATRRLDQRERRIIIGVFRDGVQQLTLAAEFDVSKQRVGELHKRALMKLRKRKNMKLRAYLEAA